MLDINQQMQVSSLLLPTRQTFKKQVLLQRATFIHLLVMIIFKNEGIAPSRQQFYYSKIQFLYSLGLLLIITTMRQQKAQQASEPINQELSKFFNLLHRDSRQATYKETQLAFGSNLSVILSTSQHDSEQTEGISPNGTGMVKYMEKGEVKASIGEVIQQLFRSQLAPVQVELVKLLEGLIEELHMQHQHNITQLLTTHHQPQAILNPQPHKPSPNHQPTHNIQKPSQHLFSLIQMQQKVTQLQSDNTFLKTLIILANESYQSLEKKLFTLEFQRKGSIASTNHRTKSKISIEDMSVYNERSRSPRMRSHLAVPKSEEAYRKMVKRVLRQGNHSHTIK